ncbi:hypothetical protein FA15DRAFT_737018 [Coprinopsis marcescibilis]|uniref:Protein kinase domain-containing protein n=1 Tax=Coprinopsis marcescibilis TaxID=230819 RepID=A0A5C3KBI4_COPMA|nr:hypothetical protein FA15DRAFT_737018 [Coprinopsis marcescibilis]
MHHIIDLLHKPLHSGLPNAVEWLKANDENLGAIKELFPQDLQAVAEEMTKGLFPQTFLLCLALASQSKVSISLLKSVLDLYNQWSTVKIKDQCLQHHAIIDTLIRFLGSESESVMEYVKSVPTRNRHEALVSLFQEIQEVSCDGVQSDVLEALLSISEATGLLPERLSCPSEYIMFTEQENPRERQKLWKGAIEKQSVAIKLIQPSAYKPRKLIKALDIARGLHYLHSRTPEIVCGNVRCSNILITSGGRACLTNVGLRARTMDLDLRMSAPELLFSNEEQPTILSDIYSFGKVCFEVRMRTPHSLRTVVFKRRAAGDALSISPIHTSPGERACLSTKHPRWFDGWWVTGVWGNQKVLGYISNAPCDQDDTASLPPSLTFSYNGESVRRTRRDNFENCKLSA